MTNMCLCLLFCSQTLFYSIQPGDSTIFLQNDFFLRLCFLAPTFSCTNSQGARTQQHTQTVTIIFKNILQRVRALDARDQTSTRSKSNKTIMFCIFLLNKTGGPPAALQSTSSCSMVLRDMTQLPQYPPQRADTFL